MLSLLQDQASKKKLIPTLQCDSRLNGEIDIKIRSIITKEHAHEQLAKHKTRDYNFDSTVFSVDDDKIDHESSSISKEKKSSNRQKQFTGTQIERTREQILLLLKKEYKTLFSLCDI